MYRCFFVVLLVQSTVTVARADCCHSYSLTMCKPDGTNAPVSASYCLDCTDGTPYCAHGRCNIFGCNCDGGCRMGRCYDVCHDCSQEVGADDVVVRRSKIALPKQTPDVVIAEADLDGNGLLDMAEAFSWVSKRNGKLPRARIIAELGLLDKNKDGYISAVEMDG